MAVRGNPNKLVPLSKRPESERKAIQDKGREVYKEKIKRAKTFKEAFTYLLQCKPGKEAIKKLEALGLKESTNLILLVTSFFEGLIGVKSINVEAFKLCLKLLGEDTAQDENGSSFTKLIEVINDVKQSKPETK